MKCPRCNIELQKSTYCNIIAFYCPHCHGTAVTVSGLRSLGVEPENVYNIWAGANAGKLGCEIFCPECGNPMRLTKLDDSCNTFYIDICICCQLIWFDFGELDKIPVVNMDGADHLPPQAREIMTISNGWEVETTPGKMPTFLNKLGIDQMWCCAALRLLLRLIFKI